MSAAEQLSFADSVTAAFAAGNLPATSLLDALNVNTNGNWSAAQDPLPNLETYMDALPAGDAQEALRDFVMAAYGPRWERLSTTPTDALSEGEQLLKSALNARLLKIGRLPEERARLADAAAAYVGVINDPDPAALAPDVVQTAISIAAESGDRAFFQAALRFALDTPDQRERRQTLYTLAKYGSEPDVIALMDTVRADTFQGQETWSVYLSALQNKIIGQAAWEKFQLDFDEVIATTPEIRKPQTARLVGYFCPAEDIDAAIAFLQSKADAMPGYERQLAQASESARLCAAFRAEKGNELAGALLAP